MEAIQGDKLRGHLEAMVLSTLQTKVSGPDQ